MISSVFATCTCIYANHVLASIFEIRVYSRLCMILFLTSSSLHQVLLICPALFSSTRLSIFFFSFPPLPWFHLPFYFPRSFYFLLLLTMFLLSTPFYSTIFIPPMAHFKLSPPLPPSPPLPSSTSSALHSLPHIHVYLFCSPPH